MTIGQRVWFYLKYQLVNLDPKISWIETKGPIWNAILGAVNVSKENKIIRFEHKGRLVTLCNAHYTLVVLLNSIINYSSNSLFYLTSDKIK